METRDFRKTEMRNCENEVKRIKYKSKLICQLYESYIAYSQYHLHELVLEWHDINGKDIRGKFRNVISPWTQY